VPTWPPDNKFPANQAAIGYVNLGNGLGGNYRLATSSLFKAEGATAVDPGADVSTLDAMTKGVR
jgi:hypothetical protein